MKTGKSPSALRHIISTSKLQRARDARLRIKRGKTYAVASQHLFFDMPRSSITGHPFDEENARAIKRARLQVRSGQTRRCRCNEQLSFVTCALKSNNFFASYVWLISDTFVVRRQRQVLHPLLRGI
jgi:hypothetical protein